MAELTDEQKQKELENALHSGVESVTEGDKSLRYKDNAQMLQALELLKRKKRASGGNAFVNPQFDKGL